MSHNSSDDLPSLAGADWLRADATQAVLRCLTENGFGARVVGGAVRNALMGRRVSDIDIATTATPEQVITAAKARGLKTVATGLAHGTITVIAAGQPYEVTTLRHDVETDGRHATVAFTDDWAADAARRDLTLNALYCDADGSVFDPLGGIADLRAGRVRFIGDAKLRIAEDYLRILRFFRFTAEYAEGAPDPVGLDAAIEMRAGLQRLSAERIRAEFLRLLAAPRAVPVIEAMAAHGLLTAILPVAPRLGCLAQLIEIETVNGLGGDVILRLAALSIAVAEDATRIARHLRLSAYEREVLEVAAELPSVAPTGSRVQSQTLLYREGVETYRRAVLLRWAQSASGPHDQAWRALLDLPLHWSPPELPVSGRDIMALGVAAGPRVGETLRDLETWWIANDFPSDRALIDRELDRILRKP